MVDKTVQIGISFSYNFDLMAYRWLIPNLQCILGNKEIDNLPY